MLLTLFIFKIAIQAVWLYYHSENTPETASISFSFLGCASAHCEFRNLHLFHIMFTLAFSLGAVGDQ